MIERPLLRWFYMEKLKNLLKQTESHMLMFGIFLVLYNWPFMAISAEKGPASMFYYLYTTWGILTGVLYLVSKCLKDNDRS